MQADYACEIVVNIFGSLSGLTRTQVNRPET
jgi:hypothetical protein